MGANRHEADEFVERWVGIVDVVRTGIVFENSTFPDMVEPPKRVPCAVIYKTMPVHNDGSVRLCCLDGVRATDMGDVFEKSVNEIWHGEEFAKARYYHETGQWDKVPFCKPCNGWVQYDYEEEVREGILIRRSPQFTYYNKIDRLKNWKGSLLGGHKPPPQHLVDGVRTTQKGQIVAGRSADIAAARADFHAEGSGAAGDSLTDPPITEDPDGLACKFRPDRWWRRADRPLALPIALAQRAVEPDELSRQRQNCTDDVFGDAGFVTISIGEHRPGRQGRTVDPIEAGTGDLHELQPSCRTPHLGSECHCHQHIDVLEPG